MAEKPDWPKAYSRKGAALHFLKRFPEAIAAFEAGLQLAPTDQALISGLEAVKAEQAGPRSRGFGGASAGASQEEQIAAVFQDPAAIEILKANPKTSAFMNDASFVQTIESIQNNPSVLPMLLQSDKRLMMALGVLLGMDVKDPDDRQADDVRIKANRAEREKTRKEEEEQAKRARETPEEREQREGKEHAVVCKEAGNSHYKKKEFEQALEQYEEAIALDPTEMSFYLNKASVFLETKDLDKSLEACNMALEVGRANGAKFEQLAKAFERRGNAYLKFDRLEEALAEYRKAQLECRNSDVDDKLSKIEKSLKSKAEKAFVNPELGKDANAQGSIKLAAGDFPGAVKAYTEAVQRDPTNSQYFVDRANVFMKLMDFGRAAEDIEKAVKLDPKNVRALSRKGKIEVFTKKYHRALESYEKGLSIDATDQECTDGLATVRAAIRTQSHAAPVGSESENDAKIRQQRAMEDPEIRAIMQDPIMQQVLRDLSSDPKAGREHLRNAVISQKIDKLIAAGILKVA